MELKVLEKKKDSIKLEVSGESHTFLNVLKEAAWGAGAKQSTYSIEHPYLSQPYIRVKSPAPAKTLAEASAAVAQEARQFAKSFKGK